MSLLPLVKEAPFQSQLRFDTDGFFMMWSFLIDCDIRLKEARNKNWIQGERSLSALEITSTSTPCE